ncbi:DMT family transporter [Melioribacteraceae bacterium 4301-Me]|uniref:DMT family transporter n=1 Tax=Pyranulibacter aquaticus TaxID=3163344 RepID=UPI003596E2FF
MYLYVKQYYKPLFSILFWGASFIATKYSLNELTPVSIVFIRQVLAVLFLGTIAIKRKRSFAVRLKDHFWIVIIALIAAFHLWIQITGLKYTSATNTGWIIGITPVFIVILSMIFFNEKLNFSKGFGILLAFSGLILLISKGKITSLNFITHKGDFLVLASTVTWSIYSIVSKKATINYPPIMAIFYQFLMMALIVLPFIFSEKAFITFFHLSVKVWAAVLFLGILCSGVSYVFWVEALKEMDAGVVGAFLYLEPFVTVVTAWLLLNEEITILTLTSGLIIIFGVILVNRK